MPTSPMPPSPGRSSRSPHLPVRFASAAAAALLGGALYAASLMAPSVVHGDGPGGSPSWTPDPAGTDALWSSGLGSPEFDGPVYAAIRTATGIVVAGDFRVAGGVAARGIARWDGTYWTPLGDGLAVGASFLACHDDTVWAGWNVYDPVNGARGDIARWDGHAWSAPFASPVIRAMTVHRGRLTIDGSSPGSVVGQWDGAQWILLGGAAFVLEGWTTVQPAASMR